MLNVSIHDTGRKVSIMDNYRYYTLLFSIEICNEYLRPNKVALAYIRIINIWRIQNNKDAASGVSIWVNTWLYSIKNSAGVTCLTRFGLKKNGHGVRVTRLVFWDITKWFVDSSGDQKPGLIVVSKLVTYNVTTLPLYWVFSCCHRCGHEYQSEWTFDALYIFLSRFFFYKFRYIFFKSVSLYIL